MEERPEPLDAQGLLAMRELDQGTGVMKRLIYLI
jgi:hypothetical protein